MLDRVIYGLALAGGTMLVYIGMTVALIFDRPRRSRWFAAASVAVVAIALGWPWAERDQSPAMILIWSALLAARAGWRLIHRPRELYVPPPDPPPLGGPYR